MVEGDEFCFRVDENGGRINVDSVLADCCLQRLRRDEQKSSRKHKKMVLCTLRRDQHHNSSASSTLAAVGIFTAFLRLCCLNKCSNRPSFRAMHRSNLLKKWTCVVAGSSLMMMMMMICGVAGQKCHRRSSGRTWLLSFPIKGYKPYGLGRKRKSPCT